MTVEQERQRATPTWKIMVNRNDLAREIQLQVLSVAVEHYVDGADAFLITVNIWDGMEQELRWLDDGAFPEGSGVEIHMGYGEDLEQMIVGEIVALEVEAGAEMPPILRVEGYDKLHRFRRGRKTRSFSEVKDSQVAEQIAQEMKLTAEVENSEIVHAHLFQYNQTDIDFLQERARRINYELLIENGTLRFRKAANYLGKLEELSYRDNLKSFSVRLTTLSQVGQVVVKGWNPVSKEAIVGLGQPGDETTKMGGNDLGVAITTGAFGESKRLILDKPVFNQAEANQMAKAIFNSMSLQFIKGEGEAIGNPRLRAGQVVEILNLGERFSGLYYLTSCHHVIDSGGYLTHFTCQRNATT